MKKHKLIFLFLAGWSCSATAQISLSSDYDDFLKSALDEYSSFVDQINKEYADFLAMPWEEVKPEFRKRPTQPPPPSPIFEEYKEEERDNRVIKYDEIVTPPTPRPQPEPINPQVVKPLNTDEWLSFNYLGIDEKVRLGSRQKYRINGRSDGDVADAWRKLSSSGLEAALSDCLALRTKYNLCDWAYLQMLNQIADTFCGNTDEATLLAAWLYCQSGYDMRLARDASRKLVLMFSSDNIIYGTYYPARNGRNYFPYGKVSGGVTISNASFPKEQQMNLNLQQLPKLPSNMTPSRNRNSSLYPEMNCEVVSNRNLIDFFNEYPNSQAPNKMMTRWATYANTPLSAEAKEKIYPVFRNAIAGKSKLEAVSRILNWVQTGFVYEYDDEVWGEDRAFFPDETIYYPYADCEDRAILFSRLVRDLVDLDVLLVYYPGHLAAAVNFPTEVKGDYVVVDGKRFTICDPTFIYGAPVGCTADGMDNSTAKLILLKR